MKQLNSRSENTRRRAWVSSFFAGSLIVALLQHGGLLRAEAAKKSAAWMTPETAAELRELEARVRAAIRKALPATVAVRGPGNSSSDGKRHPLHEKMHIEPFASGVLISSDGLILSQWHVTHDDGAPGDEVDVVLQDGRRLKAELLGADPVRDLSLLRITMPGDYPCIDLAKPNSVIRGDSVLKLGHPLGYRASRGATARLGRALYLGESIEILCDCLTFASDSGGPLINLDGDLIGILENSSAPQFVIWSLPERSGIPTCYSSVETISRLLPSMLNPPCGEKPDQSFKKQDLPEYKAMMQQRLKEIYGDTDSEVLPIADWTQGENNLAKWHDIAKQYSSTVVEVSSNKRRVAFGTVVGADGWILTKASEIPDDPRCRLASGEVVVARVVGSDPAYDLALLKVDVAGLPAVKWHVEPVRPAGTFVAAPDGQGGSIGVGIVSVAQRSLRFPSPTKITKARPYVPKPVPPEVFGGIEEGKGLLVKRVKDEAARIGIVPGDHLLSLGETSLRNHGDLTKCVEEHSPGDELPIVVERNGQHLNFSIRLAEEPYLRCPGAGARYRNFRADDFPFVFEHDIPLTLDECGGPVINLHGEAIGITIARVGEHGCMAIPADVLESLIQRLKTSDR